MKYKNKKVEIDGITFHSKKEANRYIELKLMERAGKIKDLELQPIFELQSAFKCNTGEKIRAIDYIADFKYLDLETKKITVEDVKGVRTKDFNIKRKMFLKIYPQYLFLLT